MLAELHRVMCDGGILLIREQDAEVDDDTDLFNLEHIMYDVILHRMDYDKFIKEYYAKYYSMAVLEQILAKFGFHLKWNGKITKFNPTKYYYAVFVLKKPFD